MTFEELKASLKKLYGENTTTEQAEQIGVIKGQIEKLEEEQKDFLKKHEELRNKYIEAIKNTSFPEEKSNAENKDEHDFEYYLNQEAEKRAKRN